jgi:hypothetical protein
MGQDKDAPKGNCLHAILRDSIKNNDHKTLLKEILAQDAT